MCCSAWVASRMVEDTTLASIVTHRGSALWGEGSSSWVANSRNLDCPTTGAIVSATTRLERSFNFPSVNRRMQMDISEAITNLQSNYAQTKSKVRVYHQCFQCSSPYELIVRTAFSYSIRIPKIMWIVRSACTYRGTERRCRKGESCCLMQHEGVNERQRGTCLT